MRTQLSVALLLVSSCLASHSALALLNEFDVADGYMSPFATRVWTYNPLWSFDGGNINNNYVAQHGYNAGGALSPPWALVVRNDNAADNYRFSYDFESADLAGWNPSSLGSNILVLSFDVCSTVAQNSSTANGVAMMTMGFGGTAASPGMQLGFSDSNYLMWADGSGTLNEFASYTLNPTGWERITLKLDFGADTYDLHITKLTPPTSPPIATGSSTYILGATTNVVSGMSFTNSMSAMEDLWFETFTDPEDGLGWHKAYFDNFDSMRMSNQIPEPSSGAALGLAGAFGAAIFLRHRQRG